MKAFFLLLAFAGAAWAEPIDEGYAQRLADAIYAVEGKEKARRPYGVLSVPVRGRAHAREVCLRTIRNTWERWERAGRLGDFLDFLGKRYAPLGASNDPQGLNRHWVRNTRSRMSAIKRDRILNVPSRYSVESK